MAPIINRKLSKPALLNIANNFFNVLLIYFSVEPKVQKYLTWISPVKKISHADSAEGVYDQQTGLTTVEEYVKDVYLLTFGQQQC